MLHCQDEMKKAVECGYWNLFRFNPTLKAANWATAPKLVALEAWPPVLE